MSGHAAKKQEIRVRFTKKEAGFLESGGQKHSGLPAQNGVACYVSLPNACEEKNTCHCTARHPTSSQDANIQTRGSSEQLRGRTPFSPTNEPMLSPGSNQDMLIPIYTPKSKRGAGGCGQECYLLSATVRHQLCILKRLTPASSAYPPRSTYANKKTTSGTKQPLCKNFCIQKRVTLQPPAGGPE